jgi:hypothetical protein
MAGRPRLPFGVRKILLEHRQKIIYDISLLLLQEIGILGG